MGQILHGSATTTAAVRRAIQHGQESLRVLAKRHWVNPKTVAKWKNRGSVADRPTGPKDAKSTVLSVEDEAIIVAFHRHTLLPLDDCLHALRATSPRLTRSSLHRCLRRHGISRLPEVDGDKPGKRKLKAHAIGYFHIDLAEVRTAEGKPHLFVAIDRTTKFAFVQLHEKATTRVAGDFLRALIKAVPYRIHTVLTDNRIHFTDPCSIGPAVFEIKRAIVAGEIFRAHAFEYACAENDIEHRLTKTAVEGLTPPGKQGEQGFLWDGELKGFGVRIIYSGLKTFILQYRDADGRTRRIKLGRFGAITVENARDLAKVKFGELAKGNDPAKKPDTGRKTTVAALCDWYLEEAKDGRIPGRRNRPIKASTLAMDKSRIETHIKPLLGKALVHTLKIADIERMQSDIVGGKTAATRRGSRRRDHRGTWCHRAHRVDVAKHPRARNTPRSHRSSSEQGRSELAGKKKNRRLSVPEIVKLGHAMRHAALKETESPIALAIVRLLLLTGFRISEGQGLEREWVCAAEGYVGFPDTKGDAQVRAIGPSAVKLIAQ